MGELARPIGDGRYLLVTGAGGFVGHHVVAELLGRRRPCAVLLRAPLDQRIQKLARLLGELGVDLDAHVRDGTLVPMEGSLPQTSLAPPPVPVGGIIHAAAVTRFDADGGGEPWRTNVDGTRQLLDWADAHAVRRVFLVSTAYSCGVTRETVAERFLPRPREFHNDYERTKWEAERLCVEWGRRTGGRATLLRPSIVVGAFDTGRATKFDGFYLSVRATELLDRAYADRDAATRRNIPLRIRGRAGDRQDIVPVDYLAKMIAGIAGDAAGPAPVYHLTHPDPPSGGQIKRALERYFGIGGGRFVEPAAFPDDGLTDHESLFRNVSRPVEHYMTDGPRFGRRNTEQAEARLGVRCPPYDDAALTRLFQYARATGFGRRPAQPPAGAADVSDCQVYFEQFLPAHIGRSRVARATAMDAVIRFIVEPHGQWVCRFRRGRLDEVHRGNNGLAEDFGYRADTEAFWTAISGKAHPQELFLTGRADIFGDVERALKMAMILHAFSREFPCDRQVLSQLRSQTCSNR